MNTIEKSDEKKANNGEGFKDFYFDSFKTLLDIAVRRKFNFGLDNSDVGKAALAYEILFDHSNSEVLIFDNELRSGVFDQNEVIHAFSSMVEKILTAGGDEPCLQLILKQDENRVIKHLDQSKFFHELQNKFSKEIDQIISVYSLNPEKKLRLYTEIDISHKIYKSNITVSSIPPSDYFAKEIKSFQLFEKQFLRVQKQNLDIHNDCNESVINCGLPKNQIENVLEVFNTIKDHATPIDIKKIKI